MSLKLLTLKVQRTSYEDALNKYVDFGNVFSSEEKIINYLLSFDNEKKKELFNDYKPYLEGCYNNRVNYNEGSISCESMITREIELCKIVNEKYKLGIDKLIQIFFNRIHIDSSVNLNGDFILDLRMFSGYGGNKLSEYEISPYKLENHHIKIEELQYSEL